MADGVTQAQFEALENKVAAVSARMDAGFAGVDAAFAEQRAYTEYAFEQLRTEMHERFARVDEQFARVDARFARVDEQFARVDARFARVDEQFARVDEQFARADARFARVDERFTHVDRRLDGVDEGLARIERKLDQFIDTQSKANDLAERRLRRLESRA